MDPSIRQLSLAEIEAVCADAAASGGLGAPRMLFLIPDGTRSGPIPLLFRALYRTLAATAARLDFMIALGTHPPLSSEQIYRRVGITRDEHQRDFSRARFFNHAWDEPGQLMPVGTISGAEILQLTEGRFEREVKVEVNRAVREYDQLVMVGPVFPHEVVGFSGGNKYIVPGISGPDILHFFHWLGAVVTSPCIIGRKDTPVRRVVDTAASMVPVERKAFCMVARDGGLDGLFYGAPEEAWSRAADRSARVHVVCKPRTFHTVLSCAPDLYEDLWVGGKCMYKLEPVVEDGGRLIIYAPHIREVSRTHGALIRKIGYHCRDYFLSHMDRFQDMPLGILAHSSHVKGSGTFRNGVEHPRINVVLATSIPEEECRALNLGYCDYRGINLDDYRDREEDGILLVQPAGEMLYRYVPPSSGRESGRKDAHD